MWLMRSAICSVYWVNDREVVLCLVLGSTNEFTVFEFFAQ